MILIILKQMSSCTLGVDISSAEMLFCDIWSLRAAISLPQIPAMAVEMPGSTDISGLNLQFGALQFGSEPVLPEYDSTPGAATAPANQVQNSLYPSASRFVFSRGEKHYLMRKLH